MSKFRCMLFLVLLLGQLAGITAFLADDCCARDCVEAAAGSCPSPSTFCHCCAPQMLLSAREPVLDVPHCARRVAVSHDGIRASLMAIEIFHVPKVLPA